MGKVRTISNVLKSRPTVEGAGVHLKRAFGYYEAGLFDPFLLLDDFHSDNPADYVAGFPWHPHRGIETVTYMIGGSVEHQDSLGNRGTIGSGDVQWMTAGSGIIHQEMPKKTNGTLWGFQLWVNLPSGEKMMPPRYQDVFSENIPVYSAKNGVDIQIICGKVGDIRGPVREIITNPQYLDVTLKPNTAWVHRVEPGYTVLAYILSGSGFFANNSRDGFGPENLILFSDGTEIHIATAGDQVRFLLIAGQPIKEPIAWRGPIVMNTDDELRLAFEEYRKGSFIK
jgi:redox-sensitive bicupin YhaK (pirin superfamily)